MSVGFLVWMSGSLRLIHPPLSIWFSPPHLILFISWVFLLLNRFSSSYTTRHRVRTERFLSIIQIYSATPTVHLHSLTWMPYLELVPFMLFILLLTLWMPDIAAEPQKKPCGVLCNVLVIFVCFSVSLFSLTLVFNMNYLIIIAEKWKVVFCVYSLSRSFLPLLAPVPSSSPSLRWWRQRTCFT